MNKAILDNEVQEFIRNGPHPDPSSLLFKKPLFNTVDQKELVEQIESRQKCEKKLPLWFESRQIYYPPKLSVEQSSSALTGSYKSLLARGESLADLTGGMGVDSFYFSRQVKEVIHCEINKELSEIAEYNSGILGAANLTFVASGGQEFIESGDRQFGTIYIDPSRRQGASKVFLLKDCLPDVLGMLPRLKERSLRILLKTSPLLDLRLGAGELGNVAQIHVISIKNECKELLWVIEPGFTGEPSVICALLGQQETPTFQFHPSEEKNAVADPAAAALTWLYEPDASLFKAGCFKLAASRFGLKKLHRHTHLYTSETRRDDFPGKIFRIKGISSYKEFSKGKQAKKANVISRNFPLSVAEIKKKHALADGGELSLFFVKTAGEQLSVISAERA